MLLRVEQEGAEKVPNTSSCEPKGNRNFGLRLRQVAEIGRQNCPTVGGACTLTRPAQVLSTRHVGARPDAKSCPFLLVARAKGKIDEPTRLISRRETP
jgi:hypothetical protein